MSIEITVPGRDIGLETLIESKKKAWARDLLDYLATNRHLCEAATVTVIGG